MKDLVTQSEDGQMALDLGQAKGADEKKPNIREHIAQTYTLGMTKHYKVFALSEEGLILELNSGEFKNHCVGSYAQEHKELPSSKDYIQALLGIQQQAIKGQLPVVVSENGNFARHGNQYYFRTQGHRQQVKISADGVEPIGNKESPVLFTNPSGSGFVTPAAPAKNVLGILTKYLNMSEQKSLLLISCCIKAVAPGPNPVLIFTGPQGSGKTLAANIFRKIVDPDDTNGRVQIFDNISAINGKFSDELCRRSHDTTVIVTTICPQMPNQDLVDRTIVFEFEPISETKRKPETKILIELDADLPSITGRIFSGLSSVLKNSDIELPAYSSRLADLVQTMVAAAPGLEINSEDFINALDSNRNDSVERSLNQNPVSAAAMSFMDAYEGHSWSGTATELLETLNDNVADDITSHSNWPSKPNKLSGMLNRAAPFLKNRGLDIQWGKSGQRSITLVKLAQNIEEQLPAHSSMKDFAENQLSGLSNEAAVDSTGSDGETFDVTPSVPSDSAHQEASAC